MCDTFIYCVFSGLYKVTIDKNISTVQIINFLCTKKWIRLPFAVIEQSQLSCSLGEINLYLPEILQQVYDGVIFVQYLFYYRFFLFMFADSRKYSSVYYVIHCTYLDITYKLTSTKIKITHMISHQQIG